MKFELTTSGHVYKPEDAAKLKKIGIAFEKEPRTDGKLRIDYDVKPTIEINTVEELMNFVKEYGQIVVNENLIEIYDYWRE